MGLPQIIAEKLQIYGTYDHIFSESAFICVDLRLILLHASVVAFLALFYLRLRVRNRAQFALAGHAEFDGALLRQRVKGQLVAP